jgi:ribosome biogenesis SPOUT family RNA methylase Rps3
MLFLEARTELEILEFVKYPGIRSEDSDMYTFGYSFKTWEDQSLLPMDLLS